MKSITNLKIKIFADGASKDGMLSMYEQPYVKGFTTNPSLMRQAGINDYKTFALDILKAIPDRPISFEVFADDFPTMEKQAMEIAAWGDNVYVKVPVANTQRDSSCALIKKLAAQGVKLNVTALMTLTQVRDVTAALNPKVPSHVSVLAGRIADTGRDPMPMMAAAAEMLKLMPSAELLWAGTRELLNIFQADTCGCHIITAPNDVLKKLSLVGRDLDDYSNEAIEIFYQDALAAGFVL